MKKYDYTTSIQVDATPQKAFDCINKVTKWWTENLEGHSQQLDDEFKVRFGDVHYSKQRLIEVVPDKKVVWQVTESQLNFIKDKSEWTNTKLVFEVDTDNGKTQVHFTHIGLIPNVECYDACSNAWAEYIQGSLLRLINTGKGNPAGR